MIGRVGFHAPPDAARTVEIGYAIFPAFRCRRFATEAVSALIKWAFSTGEVETVVAAVSPDNKPSLRLVEGLGFRVFGEQIDDRDGHELLLSLQPKTKGGDAVDQAARCDPARHGHRHR